MHWYIANPKLWSTIITRCVVENINVLLFRMTRCCFKHYAINDSSTGTNGLSSDLQTNSKFYFEKSIRCSLVWRTYIEHFKTKHQPENTSNRRNTGTYTLTQSNTQEPIQCIRLSDCVMKRIYIKKVFFVCLWMRFLLRTISVKKKAAKDFIVLGMRRCEANALTLCIDSVYVFVSVA